MEEPKLSFADLRKRFESGNKTQQPPTSTSTKPIVQPVEKSTNPFQSTSTTTQQSTKGAITTTFGVSKPAEASPANLTQTVPQKPKVEAEVVTKPTVPSENPKPASAFSSNLFIAKNNNEHKSVSNVPENSKPSSVITATNNTQVSSEVNKAKEEAKSSPFGSIKQTSNNQEVNTKPSVSAGVSKPTTVPTSSLSQNPFMKNNAEQKLSTTGVENNNKPSGIFTSAANTQNSSPEAKKTQEESKPSPFGSTKAVTSTIESREKQETDKSPNKPSGPSPFGGIKQPATAIVNKVNEPEQLNKSVPVNSKPAEFKPIPKEQFVTQGKTNEGVSIANKTVSNDTSGEPKVMSFKDRMKMFDKPKSEENTAKPVLKTPVASNNTTKTVGFSSNTAQEKVQTPRAADTAKTIIKEDPPVVNKTIKEPETVNKPVVGSLKQNIFLKEEAKKEEVSDKNNKPATERKNSGENKTETMTKPVTKRNADFASNLNALLGGKGPSAEPTKVVKPKEEETPSSQDAYTEALLAKPTTTTTKKKATLVFMDDDEDF